ncbi:MAG: hypothetical protein V3R96_00470 [Dehalococcoidales bacterium]
MKRHILTGIGAAILLLSVYVGIITWAEGFDHAISRTVDLWYWVAALAGGFGVQAGLFSFLRHGLRQRQVSTTTSVATSGSVSAGSMVACCAHHVADVLPVLGLSGLTAFFANYQILFIIVGVLANIVGIFFMLDAIQLSGLSRRLNSLRWNIGKLKKGSIVTAVLITGIVGLSTFLTS